MKCPYCGRTFEGNFCPGCGAPANAVPPQNYAQQPAGPGQWSGMPQTGGFPPAPRKKPCWKQWWFWVIILAAAGLLAVGACYIVTWMQEDSTAQTEQEDDWNGKSAKVIDVGGMTRGEAEAWAEKHDMKCEFYEEYSDTVPEGCIIGQNQMPGNRLDAGETIRLLLSLGSESENAGTDSADSMEHGGPDAELPEEFEEALESAEGYLEYYPYSRLGLIQALTWDGYSDESAGYAADHLDADWYANALAQAETYPRDLSKTKVYENLISEYVGQFTPEEARYAMDRLDIDWNESALRKAKNYRESLGMAGSELYDELVNGALFTPEEARYAMEHLDD